MQSGVAGAIECIKDLTAASMAQLRFLLKAALPSSQMVLRRPPLLSPLGPCCRWQAGRQPALARPPAAAPGRSLGQRPAWMASSNGIEPLARSPEPGPGPEHGPCMQRGCHAHKPLAMILADASSSSPATHPADRDVWHQHSGGGAHALEAQPAAAGAAAVHGQQQRLALQGQGVAGMFPRAGQPLLQGSDLPPWAGCQRSTLCCCCWPAQRVPSARLRIPRQSLQLLPLVQPGGPAGRRRSREGLLN